MTVMRRALLQHAVPMVRPAPDAEGVGPVERTPSSGAFTLAELMVSVTLIAVLMALLLPAITRARQSMKSVTCLANLQRIATGLRLYAHDNARRLPDPAQTGVAWEQSLLPYVPSSSFQCPSDQELAPASGSSYDWRDTGVNETTVAGRSLLEVTRPDVLLTYDTLPSWHQRGQVNVAGMDGSARSLKQEIWLEDLSRPITTVGEVLTTVNELLQKQKPAVGPLKP